MKYGLGDALGFIIMLHWIFYIYNWLSGPGRGSTVQRVSIYGFGNTLLRTDLGRTTLNISFWPSCKQILLLFSSFILNSLMKLLLYFICMVKFVKYIKSNVFSFKRNLKFEYWILQFCHWSPKQIFDSETTLI